MSRTILRLDQIHERTGIPLDTLRWHRQRGLGLGSVMWKLGRRVVAYEDDVEAWIMAQHNASTTGPAA